MRRAWGCECDDGIRPRHCSSLLTHYIGTAPEGMSTETTVARGIQRRDRFSVPTHLRADESRCQESRQRDF